MLAKVLAELIESAAIRLERGCPESGEDPASIDAEPSPIPRIRGGWADPRRVSEWLLWSSPRSEVLSIPIFQPFSPEDLRILPEETG
jgi:hypothetical protein